MACAAWTNTDCMLHNVDCKVSWEMRVGPEDDTEWLTVSCTVHGEAFYWHLSHGHDAERLCSRLGGFRLGLSFNGNRPSLDKVDFHLCCSAAQCKKVEPRQACLPHAD